MTLRPSFPRDVATPDRLNIDLLADFLELAAFFSEDGAERTSTIGNQLGIAASDDYIDLDDELTHGEEEAELSTVSCVEARCRILGTAYPFRLDDAGDVILCDLREDSLGQIAYILSLVLSNLRSVSDLLGDSALHPTTTEIRSLRNFFQFFATAAMAAEIRGHAWSFGFPRPDGSGFLKKLRAIWTCLGDGQVEPQPSAPSRAKDGGIDVFAARLHRDRFPGFLLAAAQVATGKDMRNKSVLNHMGAFKDRWFLRRPVTKFIPYMVVPFVIDRHQFIDDVRTLGNILHRLRVPRRVEEAAGLVERGVKIEGYERLNDAREWVHSYRARGRSVA